MNDCDEHGHGHSHEHSHSHSGHERKHGKMLLIGGIALIALMRHKRRMAMQAAYGDEAGEPGAWGGAWARRGAFARHGGWHRQFGGRFGPAFGHGFGGDEVTDL